MTDPRGGTAALAEQLARSDRAYFAAGARQMRFRGGMLLWMPGLHDVPAGCMAVPDLPLRSPQDFVSEALAQASRVGASQLRFYTPVLDDATISALLKAGLKPAVEHAFARAANATHGQHSRGGSARATMRPVRNSSAWAEKLRLAAALDRLPDGKEAAASHWTELERRKCEAGFMKMWLIDLDGWVCGSFGLAPSGVLLRLKNLVVHPRARRIGMGRAAAHFALEKARESGFDWVGAYGLAEGAGSALYGDCGFEIIGQQVEWTCPVAVAANSPPATMQRLAG